MINSTLENFATRLHNKLCPKCNGRCHCHSRCVFDENWDLENPANQAWINYATKLQEYATEHNMQLEKIERILCNPKENEYDLCNQLSEMF